MNEFPLTIEQHHWKERVATIAACELGRAATADRLAQYPKESLEALREATLWALRTPRDYSGLGADLVTACLVVAEIAKQCRSSGMCYKIHLEATEFVHQIPTPHHVERFVKPLARREVFATIARRKRPGQPGVTGRRMRWWSQPAASGTIVFK
jgi:alkylation response protein AidB-like acyl-CoA dehydrogenase